MKRYIEERVIEVARYIIDTQKTVRETAAKFNILNSTTHRMQLIGNGILILCLSLAKSHNIANISISLSPTIIGGRVK